MLTFLGYFWIGRDSGVASFGDGNRVDERKDENVCAEVRVAGSQIPDRLND